MNLHILTIVCVCLLVSCCGTKKIPQCDSCKIYTGNSQTQSVDRSQENEKIYANTPQFDEIKCFTDKGFTDFVETYINSCQRWDKETVELKNNKTIKQNLEQLKKINKKK